MVTAMNISDEIEQILQPYNFEMFQDLRPFLEEYWAISFAIALIYLLLIFVGQNYMKARKGFNLQGSLILWSFCLAVFSILGAVRTWVYMGTLLLRGSLKHTVCFTNFINHPIIKFWSCLFVLSKIIELGDTAFIILRKRPLIFVHWYHHSTVLVYTSFGYRYKVAAGGWFMTMNYGVHAIMYTYYTLKAAKVKPPRWFPMFVTSLQVLQMFMGAIIGILTFIWRQEQGCHTSAEELFWSFILYMTYFLLFAQYFHKTYIIPRIKAKTKSQ
ncbi:elongation of very long chain fatty acids protein 3 [Camelus ferus]|uniref:Elongation of very long chain fatty acids protein 3 n=2 Tax=Camelus TaxID=9836 RepID=S9X520_CAMFR|nr:elongation of very long chain fatty acids protein 3 [Camelus ferus]XP_010969301.1 elongation of very long chain fatty acids protein 3 [Camelus bactrianus]EPY82579.1 elongation of very long chain fatty acids-like protein [Camelus ferus]